VLIDASLQPARAEKVAATALPLAASALPARPARQTVPNTDDRVLATLEELITSGFNT
jgi:hypothetical protein